MAIRRSLIVGAALVIGVIGAPEPAATQQPQFTTLRAEFLPGERTIFYDDFTDMRAGARR